MMDSYQRRTELSVVTSSKHLSDHLQRPPANSGWVHPDFAYAFQLGSQNRLYESTERSLVTGHEWKGSPQSLQLLSQFLHAGMILGFYSRLASNSTRETVLELLTLASKDFYKLGGVDDYILNELEHLPCLKSCMALYAATLGSEDTILQSLNAMMQRRIPELPFSEDCLQVPDITFDNLLNILANVHVQATELEVCRAVRGWANATEIIPGRPFTSNQFDRNLILAHEQSRELIKYIDLSCINGDKINKEVLNLGLFLDDDIIEAQRQHAKKKTGIHPCKKNEKRGRQGYNPDGFPRNLCTPDCSADLHRNEIQRQGSQTSNLSGSASTAACNSEYGSLNSSAEDIRSNSKWLEFGAGFLRVLADVTDTLFLGP